MKKDKTISIKAKLLGTIIPVVIVIVVVLVVVVVCATLPRPNNCAIFFASVALIV